MDEEAIIENAQNAGVEMADAATEDYYKADSLLTLGASFPEVMLQIRYIFSFSKLYYSCSCLTKIVCLA